MNRLFLFAGTLVGAMILMMTVMMTLNYDDVDEQVEAGYLLWRNYGCESCHTLYGQGGNYAPDLTHIYAARGTDYIQDFMVNPAAYHPGERLMPQFTINQTEIMQLIAMFEWVDDSAIVWPPQLIMVSGSAGLNISAVEQIGLSETLSPQLERGRRIYRDRCATCHSIVEGVSLVGPSFWNIANTAAERVEGQSARDYLRSSILDPSAYLVEGYPDAMQKNFSEVFTSDEMNDLIAYLMSFDGSSE